MRSIVARTRSVLPLTPSLIAVSTTNRCARIAAVDAVGNCHPPRHLPPLAGEPARPSTPEQPSTPPGRPSFSSRAARYPIYRGKWTPRPKRRSPWAGEWKYLWQLTRYLAIASGAGRLGQPWEEPVTRVPWPWTPRRLGGIRSTRRRGRARRGAKRRGGGAAPVRTWCSPAGAAGPSPRARHRPPPPP